MELVDTAVQYYEAVWSRGDVRLLKRIMAEDHEQHDMVWQPERVGLGRRAMMGGVLAYRAAYPDLKFAVQAASFCPACAAPADTTSSSSSSTSRSSGASGGDGGAALSQHGSVFVHWRATGTNLGPIREQPPTGRTVDFSGVSHLCFDAKGKIHKSFVFRQAPADEARYFGGQPKQGHAEQHAGSQDQQL